MKETCSILLQCTESDILTWVLSEVKGYGGWRAWRLSRPTDKRTRALECVLGDLVTVDSLTAGKSIQTETKISNDTPTWSSSIQLVSRPPLMMGYLWSISVVQSRSNVVNLSTRSVQNHHVQSRSNRVLVEILKDQASFNNYAETQIKFIKKERPSYFFPLSLSLT